MAWSTVSKIFDFFRDALNDELSNIEKSKLKEANDSKSKSRRKSKRTSKKSKRSASVPIKEEKEPFSPPLSAVSHDPTTSEAEPKFQFQRVSSVVTLRSAPPSPILPVRRKAEISDVGKTSRLLGNYDTELKDQISSRSCDELFHHSFPFSRDNLETMVRSAVKRGEVEAVRDDLTKIESSRISGRVKQFIAEGQAIGNVNVHLFSDDSEVVSPMSEIDSSYEIYGSRGDGDGDFAIYDEVYFDRPELEGSTLAGVGIENSLRDSKESVFGVYSDVSLLKEQHRAPKSEKPSENRLDKTSLFTNTRLNIKNEIGDAEEREEVYADPTLCKPSLADIEKKLDRDDLLSCSSYEIIGVRRNDISEPVDLIYEDVREGKSPVLESEVSSKSESHEIIPSNISSNVDSRLEKGLQLTKDTSKQESEETNGDNNKKGEKLGHCVFNVGGTNKTPKGTETECFIEPKEKIIKPKKKKKKNVIRTIITEKQHFSAHEPNSGDFSINKYKTIEQDSQKDSLGRFGVKIPRNDGQQAEQQSKPENKFSKVSCNEDLIPVSSDAGCNSHQIKKEPSNQPALQQSNCDKQLQPTLLDNSTLFLQESENIKEVCDVAADSYDSRTPQLQTHESSGHVGVSVGKDASAVHYDRATTLESCDVNHQNILASASRFIDDEVKIHSSPKSLLEKHRLPVPSVRMTHGLTSSPSRETSNTRYSTADDSSSYQEMREKNLQSVFKRSNNEMPEKGAHNLAVEDRPLTQQHLQVDVLRSICETSNSKFFATPQGRSNSDLNAAFDLNTYKKYMSEAVKRTQIPCQLDKENQNHGSTTRPGQNKLLVEEQATARLGHDCTYAHKTLDDTCTTQKDCAPENSQISNDSVCDESKNTISEVTRTPQTKKKKKIVKKIILKKKGRVSSEHETKHNSEIVNSEQLLFNPEKNEWKILGETQQHTQDEFTKADVNGLSRTQSCTELRFEKDSCKRTNSPVDAELLRSKSSDFKTSALSQALPYLYLLENKQSGEKSRPFGDTTTQIVNPSVPSISVSEDSTSVSSRLQDSKLSSDSRSQVPLHTEKSRMATTDFIFTPQKKVIWPRVFEQQEPKAIPPWAERDAQPPPPPVSHYTSTRFTLRQTPYTGRDAPSSTPSTRRQLPQTNEDMLTKQVRMSKSESQINKVTKTGGALNVATIPKGITSDFTTSTPSNSLPSTASFISPENVTPAGEHRGTETGVNTVSKRATCANEMLKLEAQITTGGEGAVGQVAKTSCGSSYCGDTTSGGRQSPATVHTDQATRELSAGKLQVEMVTVKPGDRKIVAKGDTMGEGPIKGPHAKSSGGKRVPGNVKITSGVIRKDDSWRKEGSLKAAQMPQSPRLDSRKYKSELASSQPVVHQPTIAEQEGELPDAPWRKSPKQQRKPGSTSTQTTAPREVIPEALPETAASNVSDPIASTSTERAIAQYGVSSSVSVTEKTVLTSSSVSEISECATKSSKLSESSSSSSTLTSSSQALSNPANLPPHAPFQHKKVSGSPRGSPKNSPVLPRRGAQNTPPPAPPSSSKPSVSCGVSESVVVGTSEATGKTSLGSDATASSDSRAVCFSESMSTDTSVSFDQSPAIVLRNTVVPIPDTFPSGRDEMTENSKTTYEPPTSLPVSENSYVKKNESISFSESVSEISERKEAIKSVFDAESAQLSSLASPQEVNLPPPPLPSCTEEDDSILPPFPAPPPPPTFIPEKQASVTSNVQGVASVTDDYVPVPVTSRILSFEKQSSIEQEMSDERHFPEIKPVGPWVKKTSVGPVSRPEGWLLSPEEDKTWLPQTKQQLHAQNISQSQEAQLEPQFYYEIANTSSAIQPPPEYDTPHPPAPKPHFYQPQQYQSPAQLQQSREQEPPQFKKQPRKQPSPLQPRKQQPLPQQQLSKPKPQTDTSLRQQLQQKVLEGEGAPRHGTRDNQGPRPRPRLGSTSEQINLLYSQAQLMDAPSTPADGSSGRSADDDSEGPLFDPWCDPRNPRVIQFQGSLTGPAEFCRSRRVLQVQASLAAAFKIKSGIMNTPCTRSNMSVSTGVEIFFKKEFNQYTGSFKERGARYTLLSLTQEQKVKGVIAASAGNHALALSYHGQDLGIPVTVVMPLVAPIMKVQACRQYGANILVRGSDIGECRTIALKMAKDQDLIYINGYDHPHISNSSIITFRYDHPHILAGQGTMGLEIVEQVPNIDAVVVPVGGGGLIAGVALAVKALYPHIQVIGVESEKCPSFSAALKNGSPVYTKPESTLADGLAVPLVGVNAFATAAPLVDKVVTVREEWIAIAILRLVEQEKAVVEGAGATALAAILAGELPELKGKRVVIPLCGGNIDTTVLGRCLERGLAADGRLVKFTVTVSDRPGGIAELTRLMASLGVSIKDMTHERAWIRSDIFSVKVLCETRDHEHFLQLKSELGKRYKMIRCAMPDIVHSETNM
ncbi:Tryptophan synthase beta subunit-like PLP-dependent enzyme [Trinorchestia longiramus]|nr:Tryptophan synthase beta subunit-like PLP-dependent enzyme [Trinorchestia longiramus]